MVELWIRGERYGLRMGGGFKNGFLDMYSKRKTLRRAMNVLARFDACRASGQSQRAIVKDPASSEAQGVRQCA